MTLPRRTKQYRVNKLNILMLHEGTFDLPAEFSSGIARGDYTVLRAVHPGQEVFASGKRSEAHAVADGTRAYATQRYTKAIAAGKNTTAIAMHSKATALANRLTAKAYATVNGAKAVVGANRNGTAIDDDNIQVVWTNHNRELLNTIS
jgi:predicted RecA/RadA family phage recombinase